MALLVNDGTGIQRTVKTTEDGGQHVTHHNVDSSALPTGASTAANQASILSALGSLASEAGLTSIAGLLTTIGNVLDAVNAKLGTLGQKAMAGSAPVVLASDHSAVPIRVAPPNAAAHTNVGSATSSTQLLAANASRRALAVFNDSTEVLYLKYGTGASSTSYLAQVAPGGYWEDAFGWQGVVHGAWASVNGNARVTELT